MNCLYNILIGINLYNLYYIFLKIIVSLSELGLVNGQEIIVADATSPKSKKFILYYTDNQMDMDE